MIDKAKTEAEQFEKSCEANDEKITSLKIEGTAKEEAFKIVRENTLNSLKDHAKNADYFLQLGKEKS